MTVESNISTETSILTSQRIILSPRLSSARTVSGTRRGVKGSNIPVFLKPGQVQALLKAPTKLRDRIILRLLYYCAMRISEVMGLMIEDIDVADRVIKVCHALTPSGKPKEEKERYVPVDAETLRLLVKYAGDRTQGGLFDVGIRWVQRLIKVYAKEAGLQNWQKVTPHKLRHSFAVHWVQRGGDLERLRRILGHSSLAATQIYLRFRFEDVRREYDRIMHAISERVKPVTLRDIYEVICRIEKRLAMTESGRR